MRTWSYLEARNSSVSRLNSSACSLIGTWLPFGLIHRRELGIDRYIPAGIETGKKASRSPCTTNVRAVMTARCDGVKAGSHVKQRHAAGADAHRGERFHLQLVQQREHVGVRDDHAVLLRILGDKGLPDLAGGVEAVEQNQRLPLAMDFVVHIEVVYGVPRCDASYG